MNSADASAKPDPLQGHTREWPSTPYSDEARLAESPIESACVIALFGDCTVACTQWPPSNRPENHLRVRLRRAFPGQAFVVRNCADDGETAKGFLSSGRFDTVVKELPKLNIAFVRYGINDRKHDGIDACIANLTELCRRLKTAYPGATLVLETGMWVDYPRHYLWDRNARLAPLYDAMRAMAAREGYAVLDIFRRIAEETKNGNWDLRVRGLPNSECTVLDDSFDEFFGDDPAFFSNIHPNSTCMALIADWQIETIASIAGKTLPS